MTFNDFHFRSDVLGLQVTAWVLLPNADVMAQQGGKPLPTLYLLHGLSDDHTMWMRNTRIEQYANQYRMAVVMPQGVLFRGNVEGRIREKLVKSDLVEAVVTLGDKLFYGTGLSPCFLILRRMKPAAHSARILMIDATKILTVKRAQNVLTDENVQRIYDLYAGYSDVEDYARVVTLDDIAAKDYDLSPNKYVTYHKEEIRPYAEVLAEFRAAYEEVKMREAEFRTLINQ
jgi:type I restriction enzyme M protein